MTSTRGDSSDASFPRLLSASRDAVPAPRPSELAFHLRHGTRGFAAGLAVAVPVAIFLSGRLDDAGGPVARTPAVVIAPVAVRPIEQVRGATVAARPDAAAPAAAVTGSAELPGNTAATLVAALPLPAGPARADVGEPAPPAAAMPARPAAAPAAPAVPAAGGAEPEEITATRLAVARTLMHEGDVLGARAVLAESALASIPEAAYALAETYDPNVLAALGITEIRAEVELARLFYERALGGGLATARQRLEALR